VQAVLAARIDRLAEREKQVLQTAAVIGREFAEPILARVVELPETELAAAIRKLRAAEFIYEEALYPQAEYIFKHALTQEVAYNSLLNERRLTLHENAGEAIETIFAGRLEEHFSQLAHHYSHSRNSEKAVDYLTLAARQAIEAISARVERPLFVGLLADALRKSGRPEEAVAALDEAFAEAEQNEETWWTAELHRVRGELWLAAPANASGDAAEQSFRKAIELARQQGAKSLELRAVTSLGRLLQSHGKRDEARQTLAEIYGWFTEGFDTADLREAKALLDELSR
jgi:tetratricopeptide (TPR) repeat protein